MNPDISVAEDDVFVLDDTPPEFDDLDHRMHRKKRKYSAEIRRRLEEKLEEKWLRQELGDLDSY
jgi:guanylate kinase